MEPVKLRRTEWSVRTVTHAEAVAFIEAQHYSKGGYLTNRHIFVERDFGIARNQRFHSWWDNPYGTKSHEGRHAFLVTAILGALHRKVAAEFRDWQHARPNRLWRL